MNGRDARAIHYDAGVQGEDAKVTLWVDARAILPLKRKIIPQRKSDPPVTETYTEFKLNPQFDAKTFELSR